MKKIFTLFAALFAVFSLSAQDWKASADQIAAGAKLVDNEFATITTLHNTVTPTQITADDQPATADYADKSFGYYVPLRVTDLPSSSATEGTAYDGAIALKLVAKQNTDVTLYYRVGESKSISGYNVSDNAPLSFEQTTYKSDNGYLYVTGVFKLEAEKTYVISTKGGTIQLHAAATATGTYVKPTATTYGFNESKNSTTYSDGAVLAITGNTGKSWASSTAINGYTSIKNSNGAQNTFTSPAGKRATKVTFYAVTNDATTSAVLSEVNGDEINTTVTSLKDFANPTKIEYTFKNPVAEFTFTFKTKQVLFIMEVEYSNGPFPTWTAELAPAHTKGVYMAQYCDTIKIEDYKATLESYNDTLYILKGWYGGTADLKFKLNANQDSIFVLNEDATEAVNNRGVRTWTVKTGRTDYDRAMIYQGKSYNKLYVSKERVHLRFGTSYAYKAGSETSEKMYYAMNYSAPKASKKVASKECDYSESLKAYGEIAEHIAGKNMTDSVTVYEYLNEAKNQTYYMIPDFLGEGTGVLYFEQAEGAYTNISLFDHYSMAGAYGYINGNFFNKTLDFVTMSNPTGANIMDENGSLTIALDYQTGYGAAKQRSYYCLNVETVALPTWTAELAPAHTKGVYMAQYCDTIKIEDYKATLESYNDTLYVLRGWYGVEGYDLKFKLNANQDSIFVLNEDATEAVNNRGVRTWTVKTGRSDYDRAVIYQGKSYNKLYASKERVHLRFGTSYAYKAGSETSEKMYYAMTYSAPKASVEVSAKECSYDEATSKYTELTEKNVGKNMTEKVKVYEYYNEDKDLTYYMIPDFIGEGTGVLYFEEADGAYTNVALYDHYGMSGAYYYVNGNFINKSMDIVTLGATTGSGIMNDGTLTLELAYQTSYGGEKTNSVYCLNVSAETAIEAVNTDDANAPIFDLNGRRVSKPSTGLFIQNGKKFIVR